MSRDTTAPDASEHGKCVRLAGEPPLRRQSAPTAA